MLNFALAGNPNSGKTTLFNALTGSRARVGNWPGVTVDRREGVYKKLSENVNVVDLPGVYSLSPYTPEEVVSRNYLLDEKPDCIINIVDATNIERNLYLTTQLLEIGVPIVIALNMMDVVKKNGDEIDVLGLSHKMNIPIVEISALKHQGIDKLMSVCFEQRKKHSEEFSVVEHSNLSGVFKYIEEIIEPQDVPYSKFHIVKLIEGDSLEVTQHPKAYEKVKEKLASHDENQDFDGDFEGVVADIRYKHIEQNFSVYIKKRVSNGQLTRSDKIDKVLTNKWAGIPIFLALMFLVFHLTFGENLFFSQIPSPGVFLSQLLESGTTFISDWLNGLFQSSPAWIGGLLVDGVLGGVFAVIGFLPQILLLFLFLSILENTGYMARVAFILDRAFRKFGLSGRAFMPLLSCFGCGVVGIMGTKGLEDDKERRMSIALAPFFSCGAKLPIWATICAAIFGSFADIMVFSMYVLGIAVAIICAIILSKTTLKGGRPPYLMELPQYHRPQAKNTLIFLWERTKHYLIRAATIIAASTVVLWFLGNFDFSFNMVEAFSEGSILGSFGRLLRPLFYPLGFVSGEYGWIFIVATLTGLIAKEMVVSTLGVLCGSLALDVFLVGSLSPLAAVAFMAFNLLTVPCMAAVAAAKAELKNKKGALRNTVIFWLIVSYLVALPFGLLSFI